MERRLSKAASTKILTILLLSLLFIVRIKLVNNGVELDKKVQGKEVLVNGYKKDNDEDDDNFIEPSPQSATLLKWDKIYKKGPIVNTEFKLIFFKIPKNGCTEWKMLFRRMAGLPDMTVGIHSPKKNGLKLLRHFPIDEAQEMLTSPQWTRAVIVREPKERVLSAFLDKFVLFKTYYNKKCCRKSPAKGKSKQDRKRFQKECRDKQNEKDFSYFLKRTRDCHDQHWNPQYDYIDAKWWNAMTFVGYMDDDANHAKKLLQSIHSEIDGSSAWDKFGKTGWGENGKTAFLERDIAPHLTHANDHLKEYYTKEDELFVEKYWEIDWNQSVYHFEKFHLYNQ